MSYVSTCLADGAVGLWELSEVSGTTAIDQAGNSNGTYNGLLTYGVAGLPGAAPLTGIQPANTSANNNVKAPDVSAQHVGDVFTLEVWAKRTSTQGATQRLMGTGNVGAPDLILNASNQLALEKGQTSTIVSSTATVTDTSSYHHFVATKNGSTVKLYIDGVDVTGTVTNATCVNSNGWWIMQSNAANFPPPSGMSFAMAAVYPTALGSTAVANHYSIGSTGVAPVNNVAPVASGSPVIGQTLSCTQGSWTGDGTDAFAYQWQRDNSGGGSYSNIGSATSTTYSVQNGDYGCHLRCAVTDTDIGGSTTANSNALGLVTFGQRSGIPILT